MNVTFHFTPLEWDVYTWAAEQMKEDAEELELSAAALPVHDHSRRTATWDNSAQGLASVLADLEYRLTDQLVDVAAGAAGDELKQARKEVQAGKRVWAKIKVFAPGHTCDSDCTVDPETQICAECGSLHGEPCPECGGRGFHDLDCSMIGKVF